MKRNLRLVLVGGIALAFAAAGCSSNEEDDGGGGDAGEHESRATDIIGTAEDSVGPATPIDGAQSGGEITFLESRAYVHIDPARAYVSTYGMVGNGLIWRALNGYKKDLGGDFTLVGDLAVDPGQDVNGDCTVWQYTLKDNVFFEDGAPITATDVAYGVARAFSPDLPDGPQFLQNWLDPERAYEGPYNGGELIPPGVTVDGDKVITFTFDQPRCEMPFVAAMGTTSPVPEAEDTGTEYDVRPFASGPYKIDGTNNVDDKMVLVRNEYWEPDTDPIRLAYTDGFTFQYGQDDVDLSVRLEAMASGDENLATFRPLDASMMSTVTSNLDSYGDRLVSGPQIYNGYLAINNNRVTDIDVRRALNYAAPRDRWVQLEGGEYASKASTTFMVPVTPGYKEFDAYPYDPEMAKELLGGETVQLRYAYPDTEEWGQKADMFKDAYAEVGIELETIALPETGWYDQIGDPTNEYDLYWAGWGQDWPSGSTVIPPTLGEDGIVESGTGSTNYSYFTEPEIEAEIDRLQALPFEESAEAWGALDERIMTEYAPCVPLDYSLTISLQGSNIGGLQIDPNRSVLDVTKLYLIDPSM